MKTPNIPEDPAEFSVTKQGAEWLSDMIWGAFLVIITAISLVLVWPSSDGQAGIIVLTVLAIMGGSTFLFWMYRTGWRIGLLFGHRAMAVLFKPQLRFSWTAALDEPVLVTDRSSRPVAANQPYNLLVQTVLSEKSHSVRPVSINRIFTTVPGLAAPLFRLSRAAKNGKIHRESLPAMALGDIACCPVRYEASVAPLDKNFVIWRLHPINQNVQDTADDVRALYMDDVPIGFFSNRVDGKIVYINGWLRELLGSSKHGKSLHVHDIMAQKSARMLLQNHKSRLPRQADIMIRSGNGADMPARMITIWVGRGSDAMGWTVILANSQDDIGGDTAPILTSSADQHAWSDGGGPMFDLAPFGAARLGGKTLEDAVITDSNRALITLTSGNASPGKNFTDLFIAEEGTDKLREKLLDSFKEPVSLQLADDNETHVNVFVAIDHEGQPAAAYIIDMSAQKELELRLAQGEKMQLIGKLAGGIAHDFNNVLTGIMLNNDHLLTLHPVGDPSFDNLKNINEFAVRARNLVRMLLAYARQQTFRREIFEPGEFLSEFSILLKQLLDERVDFSVVHGHNLPMIKADKNQLETAIINLATNARDALLMDGRHGGKLVIRTSRVNYEDAHKNGFRFVAEGEYLLIEIEDNGHGIAPEHLQNIFNPFFTTKPKGLGTGLGLSTVYGIIKQSEGYICPISELGKGTTFQVYLPALNAEDIPAPEPVKADAHGSVPIDVSGRGKILLVEDEDGVRTIAASQLKSRGYEIEQACDGQEALKILQDNPGRFDLIISDVVMPGMDGPTLIREAKALLGSAKVLFMSGYAESDTAAKLDNDHEVAFMPKPFTVKQLAERVKKELLAKTETQA